MKKQKSKLAGLQKRKAVAGYLFISPFIIGFLMFLVKPLVQSFYMSFCEVTVGPNIFEMSFIGFENFRYAFRVNPDYNRLVTEELLRMALYSVSILVFSFFVALVLNQKFHGRALVRAVFFLPVILSSGVILGLETDNQLMASIAANIEDATQGISVTDALESILRTANVGTRAFEKVFEVIDNIYDVAIASGIQIIIFLSGLQTISTSMYEAADIEGCTKWESLWKITFPMISSLFLVNWVYTVVDFCMRSDNQVIDLVKERMLEFMSYGQSSAMAWSYFVFIGAFLGITSLIISKRVYYYD